MSATTLILVCLLAAPLVFAAAAPERGTHHRIFTWRNALLGGVAAFAFLGVVTAGVPASQASISANGVPS